MSLRAATYGTVWFSTLTIGPTASRWGIGWVGSGWLTTETISPTASRPEIGWVGSGWFTIETMARQSGLRFRPLQAEHYDFAIPADRWQRPAVLALCELLAEDSPFRARLETLGFAAPERG